MLDPLKKAWSAVLHPAEAPQERPLPRAIRRLDSLMAEWSEGLEDRLSPYGDSAINIAPFYDLRDGNFFKKMPGWPLEQDPSDAKPRFDKFGINLEDFESVTCLPGYRQLKHALDEAGLVLEYKTDASYEVKMGEFGGFRSLIKCTIRTASGESFKNHFIARSEPGRAALIANSKDRYWYKERDREDTIKLFTSLAGGALLFLLAAIGGMAQLAADDKKDLVRGIFSNAVNNGLPDENAESLQKLLSAQDFKLLELMADHRIAVTMNAQNMSPGTAVKLRQTDIIREEICINPNLSPAAQASVLKQAADYVLYNAGRNGRSADENFILGNGNMLVPVKTADSRPFTVQ